MSGSVVPERGSKPLTVQGLLISIRTLIEKKAPIISVIRRPEMLIQGLEELDGLVEMHEFKHALVQQIQLLLITAYTGGTKTQGHLLHTVFYGPPGVGKSRAARAMAHIWYGIGITPDMKPPPTSHPPEATASAAISILDQLATLKATLIPFRTDDVGWVKVDELLSAAVSDSRQIITLSQPDSESPRLPLPEEEVSNEIPICIAGREDFVGEYMGHTATKTIAFLNANRGKVIIIEEAYLLYTGEKDHFGMEALTLLNRFMDEHADEAIIVFTGYKELMMSTIFAAQPGLRRRCQWVFEVKGYTPAGLAAIFRSQMKGLGWTIASNLDLTAFFTRNLKAFPAYGGDTSRLAFHVKLAHSELIFKSMMEVACDLNIPEAGLTKPHLNVDILTAAFKAYSDNLIMEPSEPEPGFSIYT